MRLKRIIYSLIVMLSCISITTNAQVAKIGETNYDTFQAAIDAVQDGETITLLGECAENVSFTQTKDVSFVLDGANKVFTGSINITARAGKGAPSTLVIQNFNCTTTKTSHDFIKSVEKNYYPNNITITDCSFEGTSDISTEGYAVVAVRLKSANNILIKNCTGTGLHSFLQNTAGWDLRIDNIKIDKSLSCFAMGSVQGATIENCVLDANKFGIRFDAQYNNNAVFKDNSINAFIPVVVRKASEASNMTFSGENHFTESNTDGLWCAIGTSEYNTNGTMPTAPTGKVTVTLNDAGLDAKGVYGNYVPAVKIGEQGFETLAEALNAAKDMTGDVTVEVNDKVILNTPLSGSFSSINFVGKDTDAEIYLDVQGYITATGKKVSFTDLTLSKSEGVFMTNAGFMNVAFGVYDVVEVNYTNCMFANGAYASSGKVTYTGCTFKRSWDKYGLWAYGNVDVTVDKCVFDNYRGIKMYAENKAKTTDLTVRNTDFSALSGDKSKPAIVLTYGESITLENNTYSDTGTLELDLDGAPNGTSVTSDVPPTCVNDNGACGVLVDDKIYTTVAQAAEAAQEGSIVTLLHDSQETVELPEGAMLDRNGYTAEGVSCSQAIYGDNIAEYTIVDGTDFDFMCKKEFTTVGTLTYTRTLASDKFNALFVPFNIPLTDELLADYEFFIFQQGYYESEENCYIEVASASEDVLEANTPYLIRPKSEEAKQMELVIENASLYASTTEIATQSILADGYDFTITGTYSELSGADNAELAESYGISVNGYFAKIGNGTEENTGTLGAFRYYVQIKENNEGGESLMTARSLSIRISGESNDATGIVETENGNVKTENCYDLSGRRVQNIQKGIFIVNGKKVVK